MWGAPDPIDAGRAAERVRVPSACGHRLCRPSAPTLPEDLPIAEPPAEARCLEGEGRDEHVRAATASRFVLERCHGARAHAGSTVVLTDPSHSDSSRLPPCPPGDTGDQAFRLLHSDGELLDRVAVALNLSSSSLSSWSRAESALPVLVTVSVMGVDRAACALDRSPSIRLRGDADRGR